MLFICAAFYNVRDVYLTSSRCRASVGDRSCGNNLSVRRNVAENKSLLRRFVDPRRGAALIIPYRWKAFPSI